MVPVALKVNQSGIELGQNTTQNDKGLDVYFGKDGHAIRKMVCALKLQLHLYDEQGRYMGVAADIELQKRQDGQYYNDAISK